MLTIRSYGDWTWEATAKRYYHAVYYNDGSVGTEWQ